MLTRHRAGPIATLFTASYLAASMGVLTVAFIPQDRDPSRGMGGTPLFAISWVVLYVSTLAVYLVRRLTLRRADLVALGLGSLFVLSTVWSAQSRSTLVYGTSVALNALFVGQVATTFDLDRFVRLVLRLIVGLCVLGVVLYGIGVQAAVYNDIHERLTVIGTLPLRGVFNHKISASYYAAIGIVIALVTLSGAQRLAITAVLAVFVILTGSATGLALTVLAIGAVMFVKLAQHWRLAPNAFVAVLGVAGVASAGLGATLLPLVLNALGRDPTLTGRTLLWAWGVQAGLSRPFLGWGYEGYLGSPAAEAMRRTFRGFIDYDVPHFHNGFVQSFAELGMVGLGLLCFLILAGARAFYSQSLSTRSSAATAMASVMLLVGCASVVMNTFFKYNELTTLLLAMSLLVVAGVGFHPVSNAEEMRPDGMV